MSHIKIADQCFTPKKSRLVANFSPDDLGLTPQRVWNPSPSREHRTRPYEVPRDIRIGLSPTPETAAKFSPPPFATVIEGADRAVLVSVVADRAWHRWNQVVFEARETGVRVSIDLESQTSTSEAASHIRVDVFPRKTNESRHELLARGLRHQYPQAYDTPPELPAWWRRPIYCGWGDQVSTSMWLEGPGAESRALAYCIQGLYERWTKRLEAAGLPFGTTIIDHGWAEAGSFQVDDIRWPDLKGFIANEHECGRKVLLWIATWLWDGLPDEWCVFADGRKLIADPTHPDYVAYLQEQVHKLISPDGFDADGFKIDQLAYAPSQSRPRGGPRFGATNYYPPPEEPICLFGDGWGVELLYQYQKTIYEAAKAAKPDSLITSSTVHPLFYDSFDMIRLHDAGRIKGDVFQAMKARADLATSALPHMPIDTDDWISRDYQQWMNYTVQSKALGVPCIFYSERFLLNWEKNPTTCLIPQKDLETIAAAWKE